jgi:hypothetical protein
MGALLRCRANIRLDRDIAVLRWHNLARRALRLRVFVEREPLAPELLNRVVFDRSPDVPDRQRPSDKPWALQISRNTVRTSADVRGGKQRNGIEMRILRDVHMTIAHGCTPVAARVASVENSHPLLK